MPHHISSPDGRGSEQRLIEIRPRNQDSFGGPPHDRDALRLQEAIEAVQTVGPGEAEIRAGFVAGHPRADRIATLAAEVSRLTTLLRLTTLVLRDALEDSHDD